MIVPSLEIVRHHLRIVGASDERVHRGSPPHSLAGIHAILDPTDALLEELAVSREGIATAPYGFDSGLRTLHPHSVLRHPAGRAVVAGPDGPAWLRVPVRQGELVLVGTALGEDLARFRQGDPAAAHNRPDEPMWGFPWERPNYLYAAQLEGEDPQARPADAWLLTLADELGGQREPLLPGDAPGAIVVTGDDDAAYLESYAKQLTLLDGVPITYFLHPDTRHTRETLAGLPAGTELALHPDALADTDRYRELLAEQAAWFESFTGARPRLVRNHGYLNDGWWGHMPAWIAEGIEASANIPGVDGTVVNGSLLPARIAFDGTLTEHWSILTAFGDGLVLAMGESDAGAADRLRAAADRMRSDRMPGVIVLNLHPENTAQTTALHGAAVELVREGFHPWTLGACIDWFHNRDSRGTDPTMTD